MDAMLKQFIEKSENALQDRQSSLENTKYELLKFLQDKVIDKIQLKNIMLQARVKGTSSLREKIIRKNYFLKFETADQFIDNLPDLIGLRLVCLLEKEETLLFEEIKKLFSSEIGEGYRVIPDTQDNKPYLKINTQNQPEHQKNGHKIFKMNGQWITDLGDINIELQLKSLVHTFWGEIEHMLFYKNYAYTVGADFYKNFMESTREILHTVDYQLDIMKKQLSLKDESEQIDEIKQMATRLVYNTYQPDIHAIFGCDIDLKEAYEVVVSMYFHGIKKKSKALTQINTLISKLSSRDGQLNQDHLQFEEYKSHDSTLCIELKEFAEELDKLAKGKDVFWVTFFAVYNLLFEQDSFTKTIDNIVMTFDSFFNAYSDDFDEGIEKLIISCKLGIQKGIISAFKEYKKVDFFLENVHLNNIVTSLCNFVKENKDELYVLNEIDYTADQTGIFVEFVSFLVNLEISAVIRKEIDLSELSALKEWLENENNIWNFSKVRNEQLEAYISMKKPITLEEYNKLFEGRVGVE